MVPLKPEVVAAPKAFFMLAGALKAEAVIFKPKPDFTELPKACWAGWAGAGAGAGTGIGTGATDGAGAPEFPKVKGMPKLGVRAGLADLRCCPLAALNLGWGVATGYAGRGGLAPEPREILNAGVVVLLKISGSRLVVAVPEVGRELPKPLKPAVLLLLLLVAVGTAPGRDCPKVVTAAEVCMVRGLPNCNSEPMPRAELVTEAGGTPKRKG